MSLLKKTKKYKRKAPDALVYGLWEQMGLAKADILFSTWSDINGDGAFCDVWVALGADKLCVVSGVYSLLPNGRFGSKRLERFYNVLSQDTYQLSDLADLKAEELITSGRLVAKTGGEARALFNYTFARRNDVQKLVDMITQLKEKGRLDDSLAGDDDELYCPQCGMRYPDPNRRFCPQCMDQGKLLARVLRMLGKYKNYVAIIIATLVVATAANIFVSVFGVQTLYDGVFNPDSTWYGKLLILVLITAAIKVVQLVLASVQGAANARIAARITYDIKKMIFTAFQRLSLSFFTGRQTGGLMRQVNSDSQSIYWFFCDGVPFFLVNGLLVIGITIVLLLTNSLLTGLLFITIPIFLIIYNFAIKVFEKLYGKRFTRMRTLNSTLSDTLSGVRVVKAFSNEKIETNRFEARSGELAQTSQHANRSEFLVFPVLYMMLWFGYYFIWAAGGWMVNHQTLTFGELMVFNSLLMLLYSPISFFAEFVHWWADCSNALNRLFEVQDANPEVVERPDPVRLPSSECRGKIELKDIGFSYVKNRKILDGITLTVEAGQTLGIVGHTGAGKSTIANLLTRLYDTSTGEILIDGIPIKDLSLEDLHSCISIVSQETYLFVGTLMDNIRYAKPDATRDEVVRAAKIAHAHDFIIQLPDAYETMVGMGNKDLSGGERQRISIARAVLLNPKILIMDEATAAMDTETERHIQAALTDLTRGRTTLIIAHRLSTLRDADYLAVIENGKMPEYGTHAELIAKKGIYYNLYRMQAEALKSIGIEA